MFVANGDDTTPRVTTASMDRRIERLEDAVSHLQDSYNELDRKIDRVEINQEHLKEILSAKLATNDAKIDSISSKIDNQVSIKIDSLIDIVTKAQIKGAEMMGDIDATPAGRLVHDEIEGLKIGRETNLARINSLEKKLFFFSGGLGVLVFIINIIAPLIQSALGINH